MHILRSLWRVALLSAVLGGAGAAASEAQLISPGELSAVHVDLEGVRNCTQCHELRQRGASDARCLTCHAPLSVRIERGRGLHGSYTGQDCATCHKEHLGPSAELVRFDTLAFSHEVVGFELNGAHGAANCRSCHTEKLVRDREVRRLKASAGALSRTYLGLGTTCVACHGKDVRADDPHQDQFGDQDCASCHDERRWEEPVRFNHDTSRYPLTGRHTEVGCSACHKTVQEGQRKPFTRFRPLEFSGCGGCHNDPHRPSLGTDCATCHATGGWGQVQSPRFEQRFNHTATGFALTGAHRAASCASCHDAGRDPQISIEYAQATRSSSYPVPVVERECLSCHVDHHGGAFAVAADGPNCSGCHVDSGWTPTTFDLFRHASGPFPLKGAHRATPCVSCHAAPSADASEPAGLFGQARTECLACHLDDDPHQGQFDDQMCATCHGEVRFSEVELDHESTRFPLRGAHEQVACESCHTEETARNGSRFVRFRPLSQECRSCHTATHGPS